ncbi:MAG: RNA polymerase sigma factor (sigma-70 family) [Planctomycetota bacterium]|jgi:RNA polymerase sigma factor (sigma-70 family)
MPEPTRDLLRRVPEGDRPALSALVERYLPPLVGFVRLNAGGRLKAREGTMDLVQMVLWGVVREFDEFEWRGEPAFRSWLYGKTRLRLADRARYHGRQERDQAKEVSLEQGHSEEVILGQAYREFSTPSARLVRMEEIEKLEAAFERLTDGHREVLSRAYMLGMTRRIVLSRSVDLGLRREMDADLDGGMTTRAPLDSDFL